MNTKAVPTPTDLRARHQLHSSQFLQSREACEAVPSTPRYGTSIAAKPAPVAKSWAHFVAGGYELFSSPFLSTKHIVTDFV